MLRSLIVRTSRAILGVLSIWCLGCTSLDIVLSEVLCGSASAAACVTPTDAAEQTAGDSVSSVRQADDGRQTACGCDHCVAVQAPAAFAAAPPRLTPESVAHVPSDAPSVFREPLVPPPIGRIAA